uniref:tRNA (guanine(9)-N(1))-methyltransferase n=1 Tax=Riptortus pedestris TaxID=329032 RepID=R4WTA6_RIPPE|nr:conserved hypothetical protein [Riptortus pedestris]
MENLELSAPESESLENSGDPLSAPESESLENSANPLSGINANELSKRAQKRLLKKQKWLQYKPIKRAKEKEKLKKKREEARLKCIKLGPSRKELKHHKMALSSCKIRVALDFSFDHLMKEKDLHKCINQFNHCYSINRKCENPLQFYVTNFNGKAKELMSKHNGYRNWDVNIHEESYLGLFNKDELIYLTSDSDNVVTTLEESKVYIIGALVDHNSQKGLTLKIAKEQNIGHARLPIDEFIEMKTRRVLTIDHVFGIIVNVACCGMCWRESFLKVIPQRKGIVPKNDTDIEPTNEPKIHSTDSSTEPNILH